MPQYKLIYFDVRGLGETIRQLLVLADQPFEDVRIPLGQLTDAKKQGKCFTKITFIFLLLVYPVVPF